MVVVATQVQYLRGSLVFKDIKSRFRAPSSAFILLFRNPSLPSMVVSLVAWFRAYLLDLVKLVEEETPA